eukprot:scaffold96222_cov15-Tisochrysis_lutea.AAC.2
MFLTKRSEKFCLASQSELGGGVALHHEHPQEAQAFILQQHLHHEQPQEARPLFISNFLHNKKMNYAKSKGNDGGLLPYNEHSSSRHCC